MGEVVKLRTSERESLRLLADTFVPRTGNPQEPLGASASDLGVDRLIAQAIEEFQPQDVQKQFRSLLRAVNNPLLNLLLSGRALRFRKLPPEEREAYLREWARSRFGVKRRGYHAIKRITCFLYYSALPDGRKNPNWPGIGYDAPNDAARAEYRTPPELRIVPLAVDRETTLETDVAVVGSGAGGSVIASTIASAGHRVLVIEAGSLQTPDTFTQREFHGTDTMLERHGLMTTRDFAFGVLHGRTAGGGTTVNWMTCLRPPPFALQEWEERFGIPGLTKATFQGFVDEVWARLGVNTEEAALTPISHVLARGCDALGYRFGVDYHITPKNARGCANRCDYCNFGCIYSGKQSTLVTYLPDAQRHGARFLFDTEVQRIEVRDGRATAVEAIHRSAGRTIPITVRAKIIVVAAGAIHTPAILLRSGIREPNVGHGMRFDPTTAVGAIYDEPIRIWAGVPQTLHVDRWLNLDGQHHGFWLETVPAHPGLTALGLPWRGGREHKEAMRRYRHTAANIVLVRDRSAGRVTIDRQGNPVIDYRMVPEDREAMVQGIIESARIHAAAGARTLWSLHTEPCEIPLRDGRILAPELDAFASRVRAFGVKPNAIALFTAHAMGSVPMGASNQLPTKPTGELRSARNVFIGDGSVLPTPPGANPMITIMAMARRTASFVLWSLRAQS